jgi:hypothetical protein
MLAYNGGGASRSCIPRQSLGTRSVARFFLDSEFSDNLSVQVVMERRNINASMRATDGNDLNVQLHPDGIVALAKLHPDVAEPPAFSKSIFQVKANALLISR